jgi:hypothetical protein
VLASRADLFDTLTRLDLPTTEFVVAGSAPLLLKGLRQRITDVDVVVRAGSWEKAEQLGESSAARFDGAREIHLADGKLHVLDRWFPSLWDAEEVFASTVRVGSYRFLTLPATLTWKRHLGRPKDLRDIKQIEGFLTRTTRTRTARRAHAHAVSKTS